MSEMLLGLDFDNTIVRYDNLFYQLALDKDLIPSSIPPEKIAVRDYLRSQGKDEIFTLLQGEVYGARILDAEPAEEMLETLNSIMKLGIPMILVSHKTRFPIKGPKFDLHYAATHWLKKNNVLGYGCPLKESSIYFEETKQSKINRIKDCSCTHYLDDLPEILKHLTGEVNTILYDPNSSYSILDSDINSISSWKELICLLK